jgi:hypothetical protein
MMAGAISRGGGNINGLIGEQQAGSGAANDVMRGERKAQRDRIAQSRKEIEKARSGGSIDNPEAQARNAELDRQIEMINQDMLKSIETLDFTQFFGVIDQRSEALLTGLRQEKDRTDQRVSVYGLTSGSLGEIDKLQQVQVDLANEELKQIDERLNSRKLAFIKYEQAINLEIEANQKNPQQQKALQEQLDAKKFELKNQEELLKTQKQAAQIQKTQASITALRAIAEQTTNSVAFKSAEAAGQTAQASIAAKTAAGMSPTEAAAAFQAFADSQKQIAVLLETNAKSQIDGINDKAQAETKVAENDEARRAIEIARLQSIAAIESKTFEARARATTATYDAIRQEAERERALLNVKQENLSTEKDLAEYLGSSFSTIFNIQGQMLDQQIAAHAVTSREMENIRKNAQAMGVSAENLPEYQKLQIQYAKESAEITKSSIGRQRDFLDKALGKAFGVGSGSKFNPVMNDRMMFGEHMVGKNGLMVSGGTATIGERERRLGQRGAQRPMAPLNGAQPGFAAGQGAVGGDGVGMGVVGAKPQPAVRGPAQGPLTEMDISGNIQVRIDLKSDMLEALIDKRIVLRQKRGNV